MELGEVLRGDLEVVMFWGKIGNFITFSGNLEEIVGKNLVEMSGKKR